ncbi:hypothetical protein ACM5Q9_07540 [Advenella sp. RU8]|uniref:hypothetical protein n=1 Tax=Advenella sp. RU8 TaxID=3399575 RepID=UPI003AAA4C88
MNQIRQPLQEYLVQILNAAKRLHDHTGDISEINFLSNTPVQDLSRHELGCISQSCRELSRFYQPYIQANPQIPFETMAQFEQLLAGQETIEPMDLWEIIKVDIPRFNQQVAQAHTVLIRKTPKKA